MHIRYLAVLLILSAACLSCDLFSEEDEETIAYMRPETTLDSQPGGALSFDFSSGSDLSLFYRFAMEDEDPEWITGTISDQEDPSVFIPHTDNSPSGDRADCVLLIEAGTDLDLTLSFRTPSAASSLNGPNLSVRYAYDQGGPAENGVVSLLIRDAPEREDGAYELTLDTWVSSGGDLDDHHNGDNEVIGALEENSWYTLSMHLRSEGASSAELVSAGGTSIAELSYDFGSHSYYNPAFWAYGTDQDFSGSYQIGSFSLELPDPVQ